MAPFRYESSVDPRQSGTIADLILRRGDIAARAAHDNGAVWGGAIANVGQMIGALPGQIALGKRAQLQDSLGALQLRGATQAADDDQRLRSAYQQAGGDPGQMRAILASSGGLTLQHDQTLQAMEQQQEGRHQALTSQIGLTLHDRLRPDDPTNNLQAMQEALNTAEQHKLITSEQAQQFGAMASADPTKIPEVAKSWAGMTAAGRAEIEKTITAKPGEVTTSRWSGEPVGTPVPETRKTKAELAADAADPKSPTQAQSATALDLYDKPKDPPKPPAAGTFEDYVLRGAKAAGKNVDDLTPADIEGFRKKFNQSDDRPRVDVHLPGAANSGLDEDGLELAATAYRLTRQLPSRNAAQTGPILSRAAKQAKELGNSPAVTIQRQAAYKADSGSLDKMQKMADSAESFENKALAQTDIISELSKKVGRTGSPMLNGWLLAGKDHVLGDSDTHQLFNAVSTFSAEYAKIMEGSTGSAAGSSDSARKAAERLISATQGKGSMADTLALMKREMRLTIGGYGVTIGHITDRMGGVAPPAVTAQPPAAAAPLTPGLAGLAGRK